MEKANQIIANITASIQLIVDYALNLCAQPFYFITAVIDGLIGIWSAEEYDDEEQPEQPEYPEIHEVKGFHINTEEQAEVDKIKKQLKNNGE